MSLNAVDDNLQPGLTGDSSDGGDREPSEFEDFTLLDVYFHVRAERLFW